jgi:thiamine-monophosphate kinase
MIDISDGLGADAKHIGESSGVCLQVELERLPLGEGVPSWKQAATAGEDYELCFCVAPESRARAGEAVSAIGETNVTWVGQVQAPGPAEESQPPGAVFSDERGEVVRMKGFEHRW